MKRKAIMDDGCDPELVAGARFDGLFDIPVIEKPEQIVIPSSIVPFSERNKFTDYNTAIGFYEMDIRFSEVLISPEKFVDDFRRFKAFISPDCSLYRDAPLSVQIINVYRNRAIGSYYQRRGLYVIPQIRWGTEATYTTNVLPEAVAFSGIEKNSIVAVGTYGCIRHKDDKDQFKAGLEAMLKCLEPHVVLVYGPMPASVFNEYLHCTRFVQFDDWTRIRHRGDV
ncbi:MAG: DUF4417 domain-containing protein [Mobilibacterium timonense]|jgi:hypothetical protein|uniref:DUF4417 domain-containing protein n=1 Tax=Mobilibacterium timonense TaxID=1871012 RepID=UPI0009868FB9|nr:DUF4417 domain-containing protein [Mobilibacterium timonense]MBM6990735.1 DUF4417 domain-containing protein [Mobilibacterium timonense]